MKRGMIVDHIKYTTIFQAIGCKFLKVTYYYISPFPFCLANLINLAGKYYLTMQKIFSIVSIMSLENQEVQTEKKIP